MTVEALDQRALDEEPVLSVEFRHIGPISVFSLRGELHSGSVGALESKFDRLGRTSCQRVVVDLTEVADLDTTGARVLIGLRHYVRARGGHLTLVGMSSWVRTRLAGADARSR